MFFNVAYMCLKYSSSSFCLTVLDYFPPNWSRMEHGETCVLVDLGEQDSEYDKVVKGLKDTYTPKTIEKVNICMIINSTIYEQ